ncbi:DUF3018 family protein [Bradyrhizobium sp. CSS354]|nr:antitoxin MazE family protein [Bradyrhizobium sp. CSS354]MDE5463390.1 DUF3018 family protein [Bradyrhizobium sp. CSS354]
MAKPSRDSTREDRRQLRARGLRPIETWVPDVTSASFRAEAHRQSLAVATSTGADEDQAFIDAVSDWRGDIEPK